MDRTCMTCGRMRVVGCGLVLMIGMVAGCATSPQARRDKYLARGKQLLDKRDYTRALLEFRNAAKAMPRDAEAFYWSGMALWGGGDLENAGRSFQAALALNPNHKEAKLRLAELMAMVGDEKDIETAKKSASELLESAPGDPEMLRTLAIAEFKMGDTEDAVQTLEAAVKSAPQNVASYLLLAQTKLMQKDFRGAEDVLKKATVAAPNAVEPQLALAGIYMSTNRMGYAEAAIRHALQLQPKNGEALRALAVLQNQTGRKAEAEASFKQLSNVGEDAYKTIYGVFLFGEGRREEAIREFERLFKKEPENRRARSLLVSAYEATGKPAEARRILDEALKNHPRDLDALLQRGQMLIAAKQYDDALLDLNALIKQKPDSPEGYYWIGKAHQGQGQTFQYRQDLFKSLELNSSLLGVRVELAGALIDGDAAQEALTLLDQTPKAQTNSMAVLIRRNWALWALGNFAEMRKGIDLGLSRARLPELLIQDGMWRLKAGDPAKARVSLEEALKINPGDLRALSALKDSYLTQRQAPLAVEKVKQYAGQQPKSPEAQEFLGYILWSSGDHAAARTAFTAAKAADPHFTRADLALVQLDIVDKSWDNAAARLSGVLAADPENSVARLWLGDIQAFKGELGPALDNFRKVVATNPNDTQALNNFAYLLSEHENKPDEALKYAQKAVERDPQNAEFADTLGWILYRKGLYLQAVTTLKQAATGKDPIAKYHLAMAYAKAGDLNRGRIELAEAMKQNDKIPEARMAAEALGVSK